MTGDLASLYRTLIVDWGRENTSVRKANKLFRKRHALYMVMRKPPSGRRAIEKLVYDEMPVVRLIAATDALAWAPEEAIPILEQLARQDGPYGLDATFTLREYRAGRLDLDW